MKILQLLNMTIPAMVQRIKTARGAATTIAIGVAIFAVLAGCDSGGGTQTPPCSLSDTTADCDGDGVNNGTDEFPDDATRSCTVTPANAGSATADCDNDGSANDVDVDDDNDGLIEIRFLEDLDFVRHNLAGTSYDDGDSRSTMGAPTSEQPACDDKDGSTTRLLCGYELARSLDFNDAASYAANAVDANWYTDDLCATTDETTNLGWDPIGGLFAAIFDGNDNTITNLRICRNDSSGIGLFNQIRALGTVRDLMLMDATVEHTSTSDNNRIGLLVGMLSGRIMAVGVSQSASFNSSVTGGSGSGNSVGGLVGRNNGMIIASYATIATVSGGTNGGDNVGGLVGDNLLGSVITASYATGTANGTSGDNDSVGGLVGQNVGTIIASYATGAADGTSGSLDNVGGLVGDNQSQIIASYATGAANGTSAGSLSLDGVGGLVGGNGTTSSAITASYANGDANNNNVGRVGRLGGYVLDRFKLIASYGFGTATGLTGSVISTDGIRPAGVTLITLTAANSHADAANRWSDSVWDFGGDTTERPVLKWVTDYDGTLTGDARYLCNPDLLPTLPTPQTCGGIIPGQDMR